MYLKIIKQNLYFLLFTFFCASAQSEAEITPTEIARQVGPAVVLIKVAGASGESSGTGFIVDPSGTIVTNLHVIQSAKNVSVKLSNGDIYDQIKIRAFDARKDLAILQVSGYDLPIAELGDSDTVQTGDSVVIIGNPLGVLEGSLSAGVVSSIRNLEHAGFRIIQTDAAANPGNSGGPLVNSAGKVVGIVSFKIQGTESLNFVIPINYARGLLSSGESFSLEELVVRLSNSTEDLFATNKPQFPQRWKSLESGTTKIIRLEGDNMYVETILSETQRQAGSFTLAELQKVGEKYVGRIRGAFTCSWIGFTAFVGRHEKSNRCETSSPIEITMLTPTRIEGVTESYPPNTEFDCGKCEWKGKLQKRQFVWIPE